MNKYIFFLVFSVSLGFSFEIEKINPDIDDKSKTFYMKDDRKVLKSENNIVVPALKYEPLSSLEIKTLNLFKTKVISASSML